MPVLSLGKQPLANALLRDPSEFATEASYPLELFFCDRCALVQLVDVIAPEVLFGDYLYVTGTSETIAAHNRAYARTACDLLGLGARDLVVEIASNDGSLLACFAALGVRTLGVEPARNIAALARERGIETVNRFFDAAAADDLRAAYGSARAVVANNVLAHVDDPVDFLEGCRRLLAPDGLAMIEVPYARDMLAGVEYDTIYHEHLCYFAIAPLSRLAHRAGLRLARADFVPVHGGSVRLYFAHGAEDDPAVRQAIRDEAAAGLTSRGRWEAFGRAAASHRDALRALVAEQGARGAVLAGYGAPAKGNTLLNYCGIGPDVLPYTVDRNPLKVGRYTPGMHVPILPVEEIERRRPDVLLVLAWNFVEEIMRQQARHSARGGTFLVPIPGPRLV